MFEIKISYTHILVIGNGFDLNMNLKTGYTDFIKSDEFVYLTETKNQLAIYLKAQHELRNWVDIENELKKYSNSFILKDGKDSFEDDFNSLSNALQSYLNIIDYSNINRESYAYTLLNSLSKNEFLILDFNYTNTSRIILSELGFFESEINDRIIKVHGSLNEKQIIFGVEDGALIKPEHVFLRKAFNKGFKGVNVNSALNRAQELHFFGHSLGETDHMYFDNFFPEISHIRNIASRNINLYYYGNDGYKNLFTQLDILTRKRLSCFKQENNFKAIDASKKMRTSLSQ